MGHSGKQDGLGLADRLQAAMDAAGVSNRGLAVLLAGGTANKRQIERWRRSVRRMLGGKQQTIQAATAERLSAVLRVPVVYWPTDRGPRPRNPIDNAESLLRRLDAGEPVPPVLLDPLAAELEEVARTYLAIVARLRAYASDAGLAP